MPISSAPPTIAHQPSQPRPLFEDPESSRDFQPPADLPPPPADGLFLPASPGSNTTPGSRRSRNSMRRQTFSSSSADGEGGFDSRYASPPPRIRRSGGGKDVHFSSNRGGEDARFPSDARSVHASAVPSPRSLKSPPSPPTYEYGVLFNVDSVEGVGGGERSPERHRASPRGRRESRPSERGGDAEGGGARFAAGEETLSQTRACPYVTSQEGGNFNAVLKNYSSKISGCIVSPPRC